jgi:hypothetical protein
MEEATIRMAPSENSDSKDISLLSENDFESGLDTVCEAAAGSIEGIFGPASLTWRVDREAAVFLGAGALYCFSWRTHGSPPASRSILGLLLIRLPGSTKRSIPFTPWCLARAIRRCLRPADCIGVTPQ